jgi:hypothetical protein
MVLGDIAVVNPPTPPAGGEEETTVIGLQDVDGETGRIVTSTVGLNAPHGHRRARRHDVLFAGLSPAMDNGKVAIVESEQALVSSEFLVVRSDAVDSRWLWAHLRRPAVRRALRRRQTGSTNRQRVPADALRSLPVPQADPDEQTRLVKTLEAVDGCLAIRARSLALLETLPGAIVATSTAPPATLGSVLTASAGRGSKAPVGAPLLQADQIVDRRPLDEAELADGKARGIDLHDGDLLLPRAGGAHTARAVAFYDGDPPGAHAGSTLLRLRVGRSADVHYMWAVLQTAPVLDQIGTLGAGKGLVAADLRRVTVPVAPIMTQRVLGVRIREARLLAVQARKQERLLGRLAGAAVERALGSLETDDVAQAPMAPFDPSTFLPKLTSLLADDQRELWERIHAAGTEPEPLSALTAPERRERARHTMILLERMGAVIRAGGGADVQAWRAVTEADELPAEQ